MAPHGRPAQREEIDALVDFQCAMAAETEGLALDRPTVVGGVSAVFDDPRRGWYWVAELDGRLAGCLLVLPEWSDWRNGTVLWIHSVYVVPACRRRGVFAALYRHLQGLVRADESLRGLRLYVAEENPTAHRIYRRLGMRDDRYRLFEWMPEEPPKRP